ncbi:MAG: methylmalonyl-CoA/ethylmalonyl-CoA epimerase [Gammaproteobacteria bacterium]|jgi:methylmalonyl-CoA/ethylmalonyl-CoA epimerase
MDIERITEIGIAVHDLQQATRLFVDMLGASAEPVRTVERYQMRYCMCRVGKVDFELMEPFADQGVIADFLRKRGPGLHHVAFAVNNIDSGARQLAEKGVRFVEPAPFALRLEGVDFAGRAFNDDVKITFSQPASLLGVLFEFIEYPPGYQTP